MITLPEYTLSISMNVLEHLGINLYSNVPAVLSEIVANAWDADATVVTVDWNDQDETITIQDDGIGMTSLEVNERFLTVGYTRRDHQPGLTPKGRRPMGRKGIGKLSLFSIAGVVKVETAKDMEKSALLMNLEDIRSLISTSSGTATYKPIPLLPDTIDFEHGTRITLTNIRKRQTISSPKALSKRIARRFSIIGEAYNFKVIINSSRITPADRDYYDKLQYLWTYGDQSDVTQLSPQAQTFNRSHVLDGIPISIVGWIGTVKESGQLRDEEGENINRIAVFVRHKLAQEDILGDFSERGVYANYLIGEIHVDALDTYDGDGTERDLDAATSSRQQLVEDDQRYLYIRQFLAKELKHIQNEWSRLRGEEGVQEALTIPAVNAWLGELPNSDRRIAKQWLGKLNRVEMDRPDDKKELMKHAVLAFEAHRLNGNLHKLVNISDYSFQAVLEIFEEMDGVENSLYGQIVRQRLKVISALEEKVRTNELEKAIQQYIFDHLWLLDPSWDRVEGTSIIESSVAKMFREVDAKLSEDERKGRIDINYRKSAGQHVIVELKRPERKVRITELQTQIGKYRSAMKKILLSAGTPYEQIEFVVVLGTPPYEFEDEDGKAPALNALHGYNGRIVFYNDLLNNAQKSYQDYISAQKNTNRLSSLLQSIEDFGKDVGSETTND